MTGSMLDARAARTRFTRVRIAVLLALPVVIAACAKQSSPAPPGAAGGTMVIATTGDADVLLPPTTTVTSGINVSDLIFCRLAELKLGLNTVDDSGYRPVLARGWEHRDSTTVVFHLDPRARWQDGAPVTARDVVFTFEVYRDADVNSPLKPMLAQIDSVTRRDSLTVAFHFRRWYPEQVYDATYHMRILPRHLLDTIPRARLATAPFGRSPVGDGPYRFVSWKAGAEISLRADTAWFLGRPRLERLIWRVTPELSTAVSQLITGEADAMELIPARGQLERAQGDSTVRLVAYPSPFYAAIVFNLRQPLFADRELRRALAMAANREAVVGSVFGPFGEVAVGATSRMQWIWSDSIRQIRFDTTLAAQVLDRLGWRAPKRGAVRSRSGTPLRFTLLVPTSSQVRQQAAVILQDELRRVGVEMRIQPVEFTVMEQRTVTGDFDATFVSRTIDPSPASLLQWWSSGGGSNIGRYASPAFDSLAAAATRARTRTEAAPLWRRVLEQLNDDAPAIFVFSPRNNAAIATRFDNVSIRPDSWLATVTEWRVPEARRIARDRVAAGQ
jgi:peptide/nickel transport system substrate-binding protein